MSDANPIIEKIRKLLRMSGRTEAEADTAQILAAALAEKHGIDLETVDLTEQQSRMVITHKEIGKWGKKPVEATYAGSICRNFFEVTTLTVASWDGETVYMIGTAHHIQIAEYVFEFLLGEFRRAWNRGRGRCKKRNSFLYGCYCALYGKLQARIAQPDQSTKAIAVSWEAKREAYIAEHWGETKTAPVVKSAGITAAARKGFQAGRNIEIRPGVEGGEQTELGLLTNTGRKLLTG